MANDNKPTSGTTDSKTDSAVSKPEQALSVRLPEFFVMMSKDSNDDNGNLRNGSIGLKYGSAKTDWVWVPYMSMKKLIDFCMENKEIFNEQLTLERQRSQVSDL